MGASLYPLLFLSFGPLSSVFAGPKAEKITAQPGDNVTLICRAPNDVTVATFMWTRSHLHSYVYFQQDGHLMTEEQDPSYVNRVHLKGGMKDGDLSLILMGVNSKDNGTYECRHVGIKGRRRKRADQSKVISIVTLDIQGQTPGNTKDDKHITHQHSGAVLSCLTVFVALGVAAGLVYSKKYKGHLKNISDPLGNESQVHQKLQENENSQSKTITLNISDIQV